mmetsp:Transcript_7096/g.6295  ORF Transcript_7096/g.6295 Transcript_7096/m.6295 type:complete len:139 (+) Transcript_7096:874-1290(+)
MWLGNQNKSAYKPSTFKSSLQLRSRRKNNSTLINAGLRSRKSILMGFHPTSAKERKKTYHHNITEAKILHGSTRNTFTNRLATADTSKRLTKLAQTFRNTRRNSTSQGYVKIFKRQKTRRHTAHGVRELSTIRNIISQ